MVREVREEEWSVRGLRHNWQCLTPDIRYSRPRTVCRAVRQTSSQSFGSDLIKTNGSNKIINQSWKVSLLRCVIGIVSNSSKWSNSSRNAKKFFHLGDPPPLQAWPSQAPLYENFPSKDIFYCLCLLRALSIDLFSILQIRLQNLIHRFQYNILFNIKSPNLQTLRNYY